MTVGMRWAATRREKWAQSGTGVGMRGVGEKNITFLAETLPNCDFYSRSTFLSSRNLTGGSGVRGKADPN
jgi:hypothetical protein